MSFAAHKIAWARIIGSIDVANRFSEADRQRFAPGGMGIGDPKAAHRGRSLTASEIDGEQQLLAKVLNTHRDL